MHPNDFEKSGVDAKGEAAGTGRLSLRWLGTAGYDIRAQGHTILITENLQAMPWHRAGFIDASDLAVENAEAKIRYPETSRYSTGLRLGYPFLSGCAKTIWFPAEDIAVGSPEPADIVSF